MRAAYTAGGEMICLLCEDEGCPYCGGPEQDYHTQCIECICRQNQLPGQLDPVEYEAVVTLCLESNYDQPDYDRPSAYAAVDSMLDDESGS